MALGTFAGKDNSDSTFITLQDFSPKQMYKLIEIHENSGEQSKRREKEVHKSILVVQRLIDIIRFLGR